MRLCMCPVLMLLPKAKQSRHTATRLREEITQPPTISYRAVFGQPKRSNSLLLLQVLLKAGLRMAQAHLALILAVWLNVIMIVLVRSYTTNFRVVHSYYPLCNLFRSLVFGRLTGLEYKSHVPHPAHIFQNS